MRSFAEARERSVGVVAEFGAGDVRALGIEQRGERAQDAAFGLAAQAEQDEVVARKEGVDDLRDDGVVVADDAGEERGAVASGPPGAMARRRVMRLSRSSSLTERPTRSGVYSERRSWPSVLGRGDVGMIEV